MKSIRDIYKETIGKYVPYMVLILVVYLAIQWVDTHISRDLSATYMDCDRQKLICYLIIVCTGILWARITYLHQKIMDRLKEIENKCTGK